MKVYLISGVRRALLSVAAAMTQGLLSMSAHADDFLPPEKAFAFSAKVVDANTVRLHCDIAPGYHLYRERISAQADTQGALDVDLKVTQGSSATPVTVGWQGCADAGLCYSPDSVQMRVTLTGLGTTKNLITMSGAAGQIIPATYTTTAPENVKKAVTAPVNKTPLATDSIAPTLASGALLSSMGVAANSADDKALLKRFNLFGPSAIVFFDVASTAKVTPKVIGYQAPADFLASPSSASIL